MKDPAVWVEIEKEEGSLHMAKLVIECPNCGRYVEAKTGFFARKKEAMSRMAIQAMGRRKLNGLY